MLRDIRVDLRAVRGAGRLRRGAADLHRGRRQVSIAAQPLPPPDAAHPRRAAARSSWGWPCSAPSGRPRSTRRSTARASGSAQAIAGCPTTSSPSDLRSPRWPPRAAWSSSGELREAHRSGRKVRLTYRKGGEETRDPPRHLPLRASCSPAGCGTPWRTARAARGCGSSGSIGWTTSSCSRRATTRPRGVLGGRGRCADGKAFHADGGADAPGALLAGDRALDRGAGREDAGGGRVAHARAPARRHRLGGAARAAVRAGRRTCLEPADVRERDRPAAPGAAST